MCGIAGWASPDASRPDEGRLRVLADAIAHRGPDGEGIWTDSGIGLVHRRLAIIDLSEGGRQPMASPDGRFTVVFNGEVYNYRELRSELEKKGVAFRSESDTEVLIQALAAWGIEDGLRRLRGMFAFALWDRDERRLVLARDRIGKKPLFYTHLPDGGLAFASEANALRAVLPSVEIDAAALRLFFGLQYVPAPRTGFREIFQLEPGHYWSWRAGSHSEPKPYHAWPTETTKRSRVEIDEAIRSHLAKAVELRMLAADVSVGAFLSGGVDSAAVVAYARKHVAKLSTFTMGFAGAPEMDERAEAAEAARHFGTDHHAFEATPDDLLAVGDGLVRHYGVPYADSSALPLWLLARETAKQVKVVLTGDGGDEAFGGYRRYAAYRYAKAVSRLTMRVSALPDAMAVLGRQMGDAGAVRFADVLRGFARGPGKAYGELFCGSYFGTRGVHGFLTKEFRERTADFDAVRFVAGRMAGSDTLDAAMRFDAFSYLPDDLNVKMDRATMRWGLEARAPFLDQELFAFALQLPEAEKVAFPRKTKVALKRALRGIVPDAVLDRPKRGFQVPLATWFRGPLAGAWKDRCLDPSGPLAPYVRTEAAKRLFDENARGTDHGNRLWMLYAAAIWLDGMAFPSLPKGPDKG